MSRDVQLAMMTLPGAFNGSRKNKRKGEEKSPDVAAAAAAARTKMREPVVREPHAALHR